MRFLFHHNIHFGYDPDNPPKQKEVDMDREADINFALRENRCPDCMLTFCECDDPACELGW